MKFSNEKLLAMYTNLVRARAFDQLFIKFLAKGKLIGFFHSGEGGEAPGVGAGSVMQDGDYAWASVRGHGLPMTSASGGKEGPREYLAEHCGKQAGCCNGMSSFHGISKDHGVFGAAGSIGSVFPISLGYGVTAQKNNKQQVVIACFGDGTSNRGTLHEAFLTAACWKLPIVWVCDNNEISLMVPAKETHPTENIASLADGYGMPSAIVDGQDVIAVAEAVGVAVERARKGGGPSFIEAKCLRFGPHAIGIPDVWDAEMRSAEAVEKLRERDPIRVCREKLLKKKILTQKLIEQIDQETAEEITEAVKFVDDSPIADDPSAFDDYLYVR